VLTGKAKKIFDQAMAQAEADTAPPIALAPMGSNKFASVSRGKNLGEVLLSEIIPDPNQVRQTFDETELESMTASIKAKGILTPLRVRWREDLGKWQDVLGGKRLECARRAGLVKVPCSLVEGDMTRADCLEEQIAENEHRSAPPILETAAAWQELITLRGWTQEELGQRLHLSQGRVSKTLRLLTVPEWIQAEVRAGRLSADVAVDMGKIKDPAEQENIQMEYFAEGLGRKDVAKKVKATKSKSRKCKAAPKLHRKVTIQVDEGCTWTLACKEPVTDEDVARLARMLVEHLEHGQRKSAA